MKPEYLNTPWKDELDRSCPLNHYPRPQLQRKEWRNLNGLWDYSIVDICIQDALSDLPLSWQGQILVPFAVETELSTVAKAFLPHQTLLYRRSFTIPDSWKGQNIQLNFEAVDWYCVCLVNGKKVGEHRGGYIPFSFEISRYLVPGDNEIILAVEDGSDSGFQQRGKQVLKPEIIYYEATSGIWQTVWMEAVSPANSIQNIKMDSDADSGVLHFQVNTCSEALLRISVTESAGHVQTVSGSSRDVLSVQLNKPRLWSHEDPYLYDVNIELLQDDVVIDSVDSYTALRSVSVVTGRNGSPALALNGKSLFLHGPLDQGYWPESGLTPPSEESILFDIEKTLELGFNMSRKHIKIEPRRWYYHADRLGLLVIQDAVSGGRNCAIATLGVAGLPQLFLKDDRKQRFKKKALRHSAESREDFEKELFEMMDHLHNHPSILIWVPFNESWGQYDSLRICEEVRRKDPSRLIDHASGWVDQGGGDFCSRHTYTIPLKKKGKKEKRIHFISEYGGYNLQVKGHMWDENKKFGYKAYKNKEELGKAYQHLMREQLIPLIEDGLAAAVYTQWSDVEIESNGFYTYDRKVLKFDKTLIQSLNQEIYNEFQNRFH